MLESAREDTPKSQSTESGFERVAVVGLGYIGLPTAAVIADRGIDVAGIDIRNDVVQTVNRGEIHIVEPALDSVVRSAVQAGRLTAYSEPVEADAFLIAVPTPITADKRADVDYVMAAAAAISPRLKKGDLVVLESTSPVGTTEAMVECMAAIRPDLSFPKRGGEPQDIFVAYCPERVLPGKVVEELVSNDRAIGGMTSACTARAIALYRTFVEGELVPTDTRSAELCKLAENAFRDVNIAYANELANVCDALDMDVWEVISIANRHPRVNILQPGPGVGGHCIAVDPWFIAEAAPKDTPVIQSARRVNDARPRRARDRIFAAVDDVISQGIASPTIALLGLSFKPDIDDLRGSPAIEVAEMVVGSAPGKVLVVEPHIASLPSSLESETSRLVSFEAALAQADVVVLLVNHQAFEPAKLLECGKRLLDFRGVTAACSKS